MVTIKDHSSPYNEVQEVYMNIYEYAHPSARLALREHLSALLAAAKWRRGLRKRGP